MRIKNNIYYIGLNILMFIFFNIFFSSLLFIFKISISSLIPILSFFVSIFIISIFMKHNNNYDKIEKIKSMFLISILSLLFIVSIVFLDGKIYDYTWDGNSYHKTTIGALENGWNPVYKDLQDFGDSNSINSKVTDDSYIWGNHYAKASHIFSANIYKLTGNIECGKSINALSILSLSLIVFSIIFSKKKFIFSLLFTFVVISQPVLCSQFLTYYVDLLVYIYFVMMILSLYLLETRDNFLNISENQKYFLYMMSLVIMINIKFSSFAYAGIYCFGFYLYLFIKLILKKIKSNYFVKFTAVSFVSLLIGAFIVGLSVYPKNYIYKGNPFYPLYGKDKVEIMVQNQPDYFKKKTPIEKFVIATFSRADNIAEASKLEAQYKIPFTFTMDEITVLSSCDLRISGNGILFSGILIFSIIIIFLNLKQLYKKRKNEFFVLIIPLLINIFMIFTFGEIWWARYFPQLYFFVIVSLICLNLSKNRFIKNFTYVFFVLIFINNLLTLSLSIAESYKFTKSVNTQFTYLEYNKNKCTDLKINTSKFFGAYYNIYDKENNNFNIKYVKEITNNNYPLMNGFVSGNCEVKK